MKQPPVAPALAFAPFTGPRRVRAELVGAILRKGRVVPDDAFDQIYPSAVRTIAPFQWTPVAVVARIIELLRLDPGTRILDVGAGAGKFCIVAAAMSKAVVTGIEIQPELVDIAREAANRYRADVEFKLGSFEEEDLRSYDVAYLFNPFTAPPVLPGATDVPADRGAGRAGRAVDAAERFLDAARPGTRVVTFCGFGGAMPASFDLILRERWDGGALEIWERRT